MARLGYKKRCSLLVWWVTAIVLMAPAAYAGVQEFEILASIEGDSPQDAQEKAIDYAKKRAFFLMLNKLAPEKANDLASTMTTEQIYQHIRGYEVIQDKVVDNYYIAKYKVSVSEDLVKRMLVSDESETSLETNPMLVIPVLNDASRLMLWEGDNIWRSIWNTVALERGEDILIMPFGDPDDMAMVDASTVLSYGYESMSELAKRYGAGEIVVVSATYQPDRSPIGVLVTLRRLGPDGLDKIKDVYFEGQRKDDTFTLIMSDAAKQVADQLKEVAKQFQGEQERRLAEASEVKIRAEFRRLTDWVSMQAKLRTLPRAVQLTVDKIDIQTADATLFYTGTPEMMEQIMFANGLKVQHSVVQTVPPIWTVSLD